MILTSYITGAGHKSITEALVEELVKFPDVQVEIVEGFDLGGKANRKVGEMYGTVTRNAKPLWGLIWDMQSLAPDTLNQVMAQRIERRFLERLHAFQPDLLLSVHAMFVGSIINILEKEKLEIPFVTLLADLVSIADLWIDKRCTWTLCPSEESYKLLAEQWQVPESRLWRCNFPIRQRFYDPDREHPDREYKSGDSLRVLIMSGGEGSGNLRRTAELILLSFPKSQVTVIAGRNQKIQQFLTSELKPRFGDRIEIIGFVDNVQDYMHAADIAVVRGSPNTLLEGVMCNTPLLVVGALPGQEAANPAYVLKNDLGAVCDGNRNIVQVIEQLLAYSGAQLSAIRKAQRAFRKPQAARDIAEFLVHL
ncbi:MAG: glycosyltransferase [Symbiobacteriaceae bacterium]|nr:glycosyltransferase [Symbiobacteriaceae bacterium]